MAFDLPVTRRTFLKAAGGGALITLSFSSLHASGPEAAAHAGTSPVPDWAPEPGKARWRIDGIPKVTGQKIYARDFKAHDFSGWPTQENWLYALRCNQIDRLYEGYDLSMLPASLKPIAIIDCDRLQSENIPLAPEADPLSSQDIYWMARTGKPVDCYGQPAALLIFANFDVYRRARKLLEFNKTVIRYGALVERPTDSAPVYFSPQTQYVRNDDNGFSYVKNYKTDANGQPTPEYLKQRAQAADDIAAKIAENERNGSWTQFAASGAKSFLTPAMDPVFMEPEAGLAWYQPEVGKLHLVVGTQSANDDAQSAAGLFHAKDCKITVRDVHMVSCYPGGGFGGRDRSYFPIYLALAAPFAKAPLRWQQSRYEQFQVGLKRSETRFSESLWFDQRGQIQAMSCAFTMNAGGKKNLSPYVAQLAALSAMSCYEIPRVQASGAATYTPEVFGGSQRGFGGPQAYIAIETLMDEAAALFDDGNSFEIRRRNLLGRKAGTDKGRTVTGAPILFDLQLHALLDSLEQHSLWQGRAKLRADRAVQGLKYGVGLAMANQAFGTSGDGMFGMVEIRTDGSLHVLTPYTDMGNGAATTLGLAPAAHLGRNAAAISMSVVDPFNALRLQPMKNPADNPTAVRFLSGSSSACLGAFHQYHAVEGAARVLFLQCVLPAARTLWKAQVPASEVRWVGDALVANGISRALSWHDLNQAMRQLELPTIAAVHASYAGSFWTANYPFASGEAEVPYDYIALGMSTDKLTPLQRTLNKPVVDGAIYQRTTYAPSAALVAVSIEPASGRLTVEHVISSLSAGRQLCAPLVEGQSQGAVAMALSNVLSEACPLGEQGPGGGRWNLDRYQITRLTDMPRQELIVLPAPGDDAQNARGIAEAVMCPIAPALLNAIAMATGHRFREMPVTSAKLQGVMT